MCRIWCALARSRCASCAAIRRWPAELARLLRDFPAATAYAPHQVYIGNIGPEKLRDLPQPWFEKLIEGATAQGRFGDLVDQAKFYALLAGADQFDLISFEEKWFQAHAAKHSIGRAPRFKPLSEIQSLCDKGALPLYSGSQLVGAFEAAHEEDASLAAEVLAGKFVRQGFRGPCVAPGVSST